MSDNRIKIAATLSKSLIEDSLPPSLLDMMEKISKSLSIPWLGLLVGLSQPVQYAMDYATMDLKGSDWWEPTIFWPLMHMPSATRKSVVYKFIKDVIKSLEPEDAAEYHVWLSMTSRRVAEGGRCHISGDIMKLYALESSRCPDYGMS